MENPISDLSKIEAIIARSIDCISWIIYFFLYKVNCINIMTEETDFF